MGEPLLALLFMLSAVVAFVVAAVGWRRRRVTPAVGTLAVVAGGIGVWSMTDGLLMLNEGLTALHPLLVVKFTAVCAMPAGLHCLSLAVVDRAWRLSRRTALWLSAEPALVLAALLTNPWHHGFITVMDPAGLWGNRGANVGPLFWAHTAYSYTLIAAGIVRLLGAWLRGPRFQRGLYGSTLLGTVPPALVNVVSTFGVIRVDYLTPVGFCVTTVVVYWSLVRRSLHELVAVERTHVFDMISDMVMTVDLAGRILDLNPAADRVLRRLAPDLPARVAGVSAVDVFGVMRVGDGVETDHSVVDARGRGVDLNVRVSALVDSRGERVGWAFVGRDVTALNAQRWALREANARLQEQVATIEALRADLAEQAVRDALTGLHNRRFLMEALGREMRAAGVSGGSLSVALLDIDHFKQINDRYGHGAGDQVLMRFAKLVGGRVRAGDVVARYGGEEFVIVFPGASGEQAVERVEAIRVWVAAGRVPAGGHTLSVSFSAGVAGWCSGMDAGEVLHAADEALYAAKRAGRNRVVLAGGAGAVVSGDAVPGTGAGTGAVPGTDAGGDAVPGAGAVPGAEAEAAAA
ncbi:diguanylate cyclase [Planomonospora sp. ID82291]|uniref:histidine kinase N-terminal 7TM domain-containing diguanylate cyclase n=1 Tax=Planomonospora sp. ID82291 TaxID=2738136 RepID=UPI0018C3F065|nr:diguanylate cyclase [Planomonospora sp. ID82291]MBG0818540.1 diguanylate cyclase [Planomonospora sp. ID82291]